MNIVIISTILPHGHYTENLCRGLATLSDTHITLYTPTHEINSELPKNIIQKPIWRKNIFFIVDILKHLRKDSPDIVHLQHEFTMYGGILTALLFPLLVLLIRIAGYRVVTTLHAVVDQKQLSTDFINSFVIRKSFYINTFSFRLVFTYIYTIVSAYSNRIVCHTNILKKILITTYNVNPQKIQVIPPVIPEKKLLSAQQEKYFFYFGYMVRRKGIEHVLKGLKACTKKYPEYKLILAGGTIAGQEEALEELTDEIKKLQLDKHVEIRGFIKDEATLAKLYAQAYAIIIPAKLSIAASGPLYHARGYHKCILASNIGNFGEEIQHNINGILVDNDRWGEVLIQIIEHPELVKSLEKGSAQKAEENRAEDIAKRYYDLYLSIK